MRSAGIFAQVILLTVSLPSNLAAAEAVPSESNAAVLEILDRDIVSSDQHQSDLVLRRVEVDREGFDMTKYAEQHPNHAPTPRVVFVLVGSSSGQQKMLWYAPYSESTSLPRTIWRGAIVCLEEDRNCYVVITTSKSLNLDVDVYKLGVDQNIGPWPAQFAMKDYSSWPKNVPPIGRFRTMLQTPDICGIGAVHVLPEKESLLIYGEADYGDCEPQYFRFNLTTKEWTQVALEDHRPVVIGADGAPVFPDVINSEKGQH